MVIEALTPGGDCPEIVRASYTFDDATDSGELLDNPAIVWAPDSNAVLFSLLDSTVDRDRRPQRTMRLDATPGAVPTMVLDATAGCRLPLGWSVTNRVLFDCVRFNGSGTAETFHSTLETMAVTGGPRKVIDTANGTQVTTTPFWAFHFGYFVPGTSTVVYNDGSILYPNPNGNIPWYRVHLYDDTTGDETAILGTDPAVTTHLEALPDRQPTTSTNIPNAEMVERFTR
jgi:hypothetical protein